MNAVENQFSLNRGASIKQIPISADIVCVQHEFGIYGGMAGSHLLALLRELRVPVVSTLPGRFCRLFKPSL